MKDKKGAFLIAMIVHFFIKKTHPEILSGRVYSYERHW
jgi:hypothetical protein